MKRILMATFVLGLGASTASAQLQLRGSDTLFDFTNHLVGICEPNITSSELVYRGGGSSLGENEMEANNQEISPMSRFIDATSCTSGGQSGVANDGQGCKVALDGLGFFADDAEANDCDTLRFGGFMEVLDQNGIAGIDNGVAAGDLTALGLVDGPDADGVLDHYEFSDWRDVARIVYGGQHLHKPVSACQDPPFPSRSAIGEKRCNSDVRHTLVNAWSNLFQNGAGCNGTDPDACVQLKHAWRRDDVSGTTDVFLEVLALPAITTTPFCNGVEQEDEDPVRRDCTEVTAAGDEQICNTVALSLLGPNNTGNSQGWRGGPTVNPANDTSADIGLVQAMVIPPVNPYNDNNSCAAAGFGGAFRYAPMPTSFSTAGQRCPDGNARVSGQCQWPARLVSGSFVFGCVNQRTNKPGARTIANIDGRVYNLIARNADGTIQTVPRVQSIGGMPTEVQVGVHHAMYRIHQTRVMPGGNPPPSATGCREPDATNQIGCLAAASPCSIGFAGLTADQQANNKPLALREAAVLCNADGVDNDGDATTDESDEPCLGVLPDPEIVRRLNDPFGAGCETAGNYEARYPFARFLWFNAIDGFEGADGIPRNFDRIPNTNREQDLIKCACDRFYADQSAVVAGYIPLTSLAAGQCDTANEGGVCDNPIRTCP
jgi:hypothetical protein